MALYRYEALSDRGRKVKGIINADSYQLAKELLRRQKIFVTKLFVYQEKQKSVTITPAMLIAFTRELSQLLKAGLPLYESLLAIEEKYQNHASHPLLLDLCDQVKLGKHLSQALGLYPKAFDQIYISMVASGEETGELSGVFLQLEKLLSRQQKLKKQLISAMIYPLFLLSFCFLVTGALFFFLIPSMQQLFEGRELHPMTQGVLNVSFFLRKHLYTLLGALSFATIGGVLFFRSRKGVLLFQRSLLKIPLLKRMITQSVLTRFTRALSIMLSSSVPLLEGLRLSKKIMHHPLFEEAVASAEKQIMQGGKLSSELAKSSLFPSLVIRMVAISEEAGNLSEMLQNVSEIYEEELEKSLTRFTSMLQPIMLLFLAIIVGVVILSILLPLTDVGSFLST